MHSGTRIFAGPDGSFSRCFQKRPAASLPLLPAPRAPLSATSLSAFLYELRSSPARRSKMAEHPYIVASDSETTGDDRTQSAFRDIAIGIDVGTSKCSIAVWNGTQVELLKNARNQKAMRSYVMFGDDIPAGDASEEQKHEERDIFSGSAIFNIKRLIGRADTDPIVHSSKILPYLVQTLDIGVRPFIAALVNNVWRYTTPEEVLAIVLVELKTMAEIKLQRVIRNVVLTIPVSFSRFQLTRIERACAMAGLNVLRLMPEPTAVALLYAQQQQQSLHENMGSGCEKVALIFNIGAGYSDVAVTATAGGVSQIRAMLGCTVGGEDILQNVMYFLLPNFDSLFPTHDVNRIRCVGLLRIAAQNSIHKLSTQSSVQINVDLAEGIKIDRVLHRSEFEEVNRNVFDTCEKLIKQCLADARVPADGIDDVILVGGCSRIPKIKDLVLGLCNKELDYEGVDALEAAVVGAAIEGAVASGITDPSGSLDLLTIQATPLSLGIRVEKGEFAPIIHRNTVIPARKDMIFTTTRDDQSEALILVYEGDGKTLEENHLLGYFKMTGLPPGPKSTAEISVSMDIDAANILRVFAGVVPGADLTVLPFMEVRMPMVDDGHDWCAQALLETHGSNLDVAIIPKKLQS